MNNIPVVKLGIVAVSRNCFPMELSHKRRDAVVDAYKSAGGEVSIIQTIVENENDSLKALKEAKDLGINALCIFLGNFGPEGPETLIAQEFDGPVMFAAAAEESKDTLLTARGDAYCGILNASYNIALRNLTVHMPEYPVGTAKEVAAMMAEFVPISRIVIGVKSLKIIGFGPRPFDFMACNAPIKPFYNLGVEVQENSELDLFASYNAHANDPRIKDIEADMVKELGTGNKMPGILTKLAQYELTLLDWVDNNKGASDFVALAAKCWPAFQTEFGFVPCYVNSRLTTNLLPVACEVDLYGALSEYIISCATLIPPTLLDINNTVPYDLYDSEIKGKFDYTKHDVFMGFHCGNTPACHLVNPEMKFQKIMHSLLEPDSEPDITRGTLEGDIKPGNITFFRLQSNAEGELKSYIAEGEVLPVATQSFGGIGIFAIAEMKRFYRHVLVQDRYPHHGGVAFAKVGSIIFSALKMLGVDNISYNQPKSIPYKSENPFA